MNENQFSTGGAVAGILFTVLGVLFLLRAFDVIEIRFDVVLSVAVIALGVALVGGAVLRSGRRERGETEPRA